jgi:hypothetical protein
MLAVRDLEKCGIWGKMCMPNGNLQQCMPQATMDFSESSSCLAECDSMLINEDG